MDYIEIKETIGHYKVIIKINRESKKIFFIKAFVVIEIFLFEYVNMWLECTKNFTKFVVIIEISQKKRYDFLNPQTNIGLKKSYIL